MRRFRRTNRTQLVRRILGDVPPDLVSRGVWAMSPLKMLGVGVGNRHLERFKPFVVEVTCRVCHPRRCVLSLSASSLSGLPAQYPLRQVSDRS